MMEPSTAHMNVLKVTTSSVVAYGLFAAYMDSKKKSIDKYKATVPKFEPTDMEVNYLQFLLTNKSIEKMQQMISQKLADRYGVETTRKLKSMDSQFAYWATYRGKLERIHALCGREMAGKKTEFLTEYLAIFDGKAPQHAKQQAGSTDFMKDLESRISASLDEIIKLCASHRDRQLRTSQPDSAQRVRQIWNEFKNAQMMHETDTSHQHIQGLIDAICKR